MWNAGLVPVLFHSAFRNRNSAFEEGFLLTLTPLIKKASMD
jgi:hypothetical protein